MKAMMSYSLKMNLIFIILLFLLQTIDGREIKKRQIYREQVLPHAGGKIPDTAFQSDRLALNRLQTEGIAVPDGIVLEQRSHRVHQYYNKAIRPTFKVTLTPDGRYTPIEGKSMFNNEAIETTYLVPQIYQQYQQQTSKTPFKPVIKTFSLPNTYLRSENHLSENLPISSIVSQHNNYQELDNYYYPHNKFHSSSYLGNKQEHLQTPTSLYDWNKQFNYNNNNQKFYQDFDTFINQFNLKTALNHNNHYKYPATSYANTVHLK